MVIQATEVMDEGGPYLEFEFMGRPVSVDMEQRWLARSIDAVFLGEGFGDIFEDIPLADGAVVRYTGTTTNPDVVRVVKEWWKRIVKG